MAGHQVKEVCEFSSENKFQIMAKGDSLMMKK